MLARDVGSAGAASAAPAAALDAAPVPGGLGAAPAPRRPSVSARRVAREAESDRPHLSLVKPESAPRTSVQRSAAERLAEQTGGMVESGEGALRTVHFPAPGTGAAPLPITTQQPHTISRALTDGGAAATPTTTTTPTPSSDPANPDTGANDAKKAAEREEMYEYFLDRFKRDLLAEREQSGYLIIDNP